MPEVYRPITTEQGFKRFNDIPELYWCCGWIEGTTTAVNFTNEHEPLEPPTYPNAPAILDGVATLVSDGWQFFLDTVANEGITIPPELFEDEQQ